MKKLVRYFVLIALLASVLIACFSCVRYGMPKVVEETPLGTGDVGISVVQGAAQAAVGTISDAKKLELESRVKDALQKYEIMLSESGSTVPLGTIVIIPDEARYFKYEYNMVDGATSIIYDAENPYSEMPAVVGEPITITDVTSGALVFPPQA